MSDTRLFYGDRQYSIHGDGSLWFKRRGNPPEPAPGFQTSDDPYVIIPLQCKSFEDRAEQVGCCLATRQYCKFFDRYISREDCLGCTSKS